MEASSPAPEVAGELAVLLKKEVKVPALPPKKLLQSILCKVSPRLRPYSMESNGKDVLTTLCTSLNTLLLRGPQDHIELSRCTSCERPAPPLHDSNRSMLKEVNMFLFGFCNFTHQTMDT